MKKDNWKLTMVFVIMAMVAILTLLITIGLKN